MNRSAGRRVGIAVVGAGNISSEYLRNLTAFPDVEVLFVADLDVDRARAQAAAYGVPMAGGLGAALDHPEVELVVNITNPAAHEALSRASLEAGKHVWTEKPLALDKKSGRELCDLAERLSLRIGSAPDTFLGRGLQSLQAAIARGDIGEPVSAVTMMQDSGPESWHPQPDFIYQRGAGPLWDRGPYYLAMLVQVFGSMRRVSALATQSSTSRVIGSGPREGERFAVEVPTNIGVLTEFDDGRIAQSTYSYESPVVRMGFVEISGTEATIAAPDPNRFTGDLLIYPTRRWTLEELRRRKPGSPDPSEWTVRSTGEWRASRGTGVLDLARSIRGGTPHRASAELGFHVLDALQSITESVQSGEAVRLTSDTSIPELLPPGWDPYEPTL